MVVKELVDLSLVQNISRPLLGPFRDFCIIPNYPSVFFEPLPRRKGMGEAVEFVDIRQSEPQQTFEIRAHHHDGGNEVSILLQNPILLPKGDRYVHLRDSKLEDQVGKRLSLP